MRRTLTNERGVVLILGLIMLVVLSFIGLAAMQSTTLQERMAGNLQQRDRAFQNAEAGLRAAEAWLNNQVILPAFDSQCNNGLCLPPAAGQAWWNTLDWDDANKYDTYQEGEDEGEVTARYIIEHVANTLVSGSDSIKLAPAPEEGSGIYRIVSRGVSPNGLVEVFLQTTFVR